MKSHFKNSSFKIMKNKKLKNFFKMKNRNFNLKILFFTLKRLKIYMMK